MSIIRYFFLNILFISLNMLPTFSILLGPSGDAKNTGRQIEDSLERGISFQFAQELKQTLESIYSDIRVILTRSPGETIYPFQNANFSNKLDVDFYLSIHFYPEKNTKPSIFLYYFSLADDFITKIKNLFFWPYDKAHRINGKTTRSYAKNISKSLTNDQYKTVFNFQGPLGIPFKPLIGIKAPAIALEIGLKKKTEWKKYIEPIAKSLEKIIK